MKLITFIASLIFCYSSAYADFSEITNADMVCVSSGAAYFFDFNEDTLKPDAIWQAGSANDQEGFLLIRVRSEKLACDYCYDINAGLSVFGGVVPLSLKMRSEDGAVNLVVRIAADDEDFTVELECSEL